MNCYSFPLRCFKKVILRLCENFDLIYEIFTLGKRGVTTYKNPHENLQEYLQNFLRNHERKRKRKRKTLPQEKLQQMYSLPVDINVVREFARNLSWALKNSSNNSYGLLFVEKSTDISRNSRSEVSKRNLFFAYNMEIVDDKNFTTYQAKFYTIVVISCRHLFPPQHWVSLHSLKHSDYDMLQQLHIYLIVK